jgi:hypothetical protein
MILAFEQARAVHTLDRAATVIGSLTYRLHNLLDIDKDLTGYRRLLLASFLLKLISTLKMEASFSSEMSSFILIIQHYNLYAMWSRNVSTVT